MRVNARLLRIVGLRQIVGQQFVKRNRIIKVRRKRPRIPKGESRRSLQPTNTAMYIRFLHSPSAIPTATASAISRALSHSLTTSTTAIPNGGSDLGADALWMTPINPSESYHKYSVEDYYNVDESFGTLDDFDETGRGVSQARHQRHPRLGAQPHILQKSAVFGGVRGGTAGKARRQGTVF